MNTSAPTKRKRALLDRDERRLRRARAVSLVAAGATTGSAAADVGLKADTVRRACRDAGCPRRPADRPRTVAPKARVGRRAKLLGQPFDRLVVERYAGSTRAGDCLWHCACVCGGTAVASTRNLRAGHTRSCGCFREERSAAAAAARAARRGAPAGGDR